MDYVEDSNSYLQGTANYVMNEAIPFYNLGDAVRQPLSYGALGEEMYRTPSSEQGYISASISYLDSGKNKETRNIKEVMLYEGSAVLWGANEYTPTVSVGKSITKEQKDADLKQLCEQLISLSKMKNAGGELTDYTNELIEIKIAQTEQLINILK